MRTIDEARLTRQCIVVASRRHGRARRPFRRGPDGIFARRQRPRGPVQPAVARRNGGKFILRPDNTNRARSEPEFEAAIGRDLTWLGLVWDIGERQSDRHALYDGERERLIPARRKLESEGRAYPVAAAEVLDGLGAQLSTQVRSVLEAWTTALSAASGRKGLRSPMRCVSR